MTSVRLPGPAPGDALLLAAGELAGQALLVAERLTWATASAVRFWASSFSTYAF
jgi:hypothetical protein